jgi:hypothetical protein
VRRFNTRNAFFFKFHNAIFQVVQRELAADLLLVSLSSVFRWYFELSVVLYPSNKTSRANEVKRILFVGESNFKP